MRHTAAVCGVLAMALAVGVGLAGNARGQQQQQQSFRSPEVVRHRHDAIMSQLDQGGDVTVVLNVEGVLAGLFRDVVRLDESTASSAEAAKAVETVRKVEAFLGTNGFYALHGMGMSAVPKSDGLNKVKFFFARDPAAANLPLWRGCWGGLKPRRLQCLDYVPSDAVLVRVANAELAQVWKVVRQAVKQVATPEGAASFDKSIAETSKSLGIGVDELVNTLGDEVFVSIQLSKEVRVNLPGPGGKPMEIPEPSVLIGLRVRNDLLWRTVTRQLATNEVPVVITRKGETEIRSVNLPGASPIPLQISCAMHGGVFLLGSNSKVVEAAVESATARNGLACTAEFRKATEGEGLPMENNGLFYMHPRFSATLRAVQAASFEGTEQAALAKGIMDIFYGPADASAVFVNLNLSNGVLVQGVSTTGGRDVIASATIAPVGLMAAIAVPAIMKSRDTARRSACIGNLRMFDCAKDMCTIEKNKKQGDEVTPEDLKGYMGGNRLPVCPKGGTYSLNPIGVKPTCSVPGHGLPD